MAGGDLRSYLNKVGKLSEDAVRIYAAQLLLGLEHIHSCKVVYRDLKPENILIDEKGHLVIADFGLSDRLRKSRKNEKLAGRTGTRKYMAPEQLNRQHYNQSVDFWALGILICEMLTGLRPFRQPEECLEYKPSYRQPISPEATSLLDGLLTFSPRERLGSPPGGYANVFNHAFFRDLDFEKVFNREIETPFTPKPKVLQKTGNIDPNETDFQRFKLSNKQQGEFKKFDYNTRRVQYGPSGEILDPQKGITVHRKHNLKKWQNPR
eukprot:401293_1